LYVFPSIEALASGQPEQFRQTFGSASFAIDASRLGAFVQDRWTPHSSLAIDAGLRLDAGRVPAADVRSVTAGPRLGLAWTRGPQWVVRGGAGIFAGRLALAPFARALTSNGSQGFEQIVDGPGAAAAFAAARGGRLDVPLTGVARSVYRARSGSWNSSSRQVGA